MKIYLHLKSYAKDARSWPSARTLEGAFSVRGVHVFFAGLVLLAAGLTTGCNKKDTGAAANPPAAPSAPATEAAAESATVPPSPRGPVGLNTTPTAPTVIQDSANFDAVLSQLSAELRKYVARSRSVPKDFEEFVAKSLVQAPPAPAGKKYAIQNQAVVLVKR